MLIIFLMTIKSKKYIQIISISYLYRDEEHVLVFWREVLQEFFSHVLGGSRISFRKSDLVKTFTLHNRKPAGLINIMVCSKI